jgi:hypothetical protein
MLIDWAIRAYPTRSDGWQPDEGCRGPCPCGSGKKYKKMLRWDDRELSALRLVGSFSPEPLVGSAPPTLLGRGGRHCYGINYTQEPVVGEMAIFGTGKDRSRGSPL